MVKFKRPDAIAKMMSEAASHLPDATMAFYSLVSANPEARPALATKPAPGKARPSPAAFRKALLPTIQGTRPSNAPAT